MKDFLSSKAVLTGSDLDISPEQLQKLYQQLKKERQSEYSRRGGKYKATVKQKRTASQTIRSTHPWEKSTGAKTPEGKLRQAAHRSVWLKLEFCAPTAEELDRVTGNISEALTRFHEEMRRQELGVVKVEIKTTIEGRGQVSDRAALSQLNTGIIFTHKRVFKVRLSKWKAEDGDRISELWKECQNRLLESE